jgi:hypothetical protein
MPEQTALEREPLMDRRQGYRPERDRSEEQAKGGELDEAGEEHTLGHRFHSLLMERSLFLFCSV